LAPFTSLGLERFRDALQLLHKVHREVAEGLLRQAYGSLQQAPRRAHRRIRAENHLRLTGSRDAVHRQVTFDLRSGASVRIRTASLTAATRVTSRIVVRIPPPIRTWLPAVSLRRSSRFQPPKAVWARTFNASSFGMTPFCSRLERRFDSLPRRCPGRANRHARTFATNHVSACEWARRGSLCEFGLDHASALEGSFQARSCHCGAHCRACHRPFWRSSAARGAPGGMLLLPFIVYARPTRGG